MNGKILVVFTVLTLLGVAIFFITRPPRDDTDKEPMLLKVRQNFSLLDPDYTKIPLAEGGSSYTENKSAITLCLRDPETGELYDINTIMYVALHELAHVISKNHGHGSEFKDNFEKILKKAASIGIYDPTRSIPSNYCGITD